MFTRVLIIIITTLTFTSFTKTAFAKDSKKDHHVGLTSKDFPSAEKCAKCHDNIYQEWRSSNHAYSLMSPMFHQFEDTINVLTQGTLANFCVRCHGTIGTTMNEKREMPIWERSKVSREGITCITCHRVNEDFGKVNGERRIVPGDIHQPVFGPTDGKIFDSVIAQKDYYKVAPTKTDKGIKVHSKASQFKTIGKSEFCMGCHQVAVHPGIKLEVVWDQYRGSPALKNGVTCQDCHMGKDPGKASGYATGPAAIINGKPINSKRKHANHSFYGPGYTIAHPGLFPHNVKAQQFEIQDWLKFDHRAGWGTDDFEEKIENEELTVEFPDAWEDVDDRIEAREIVEENLKLLDDKKQLRLKTMENGSKLDGPFFSSDKEPGESLSFHYVVTNTNSGHNLPSGSLGAQPELWLNVVLTDPSGKRVWESGYVDSVGDMCDLHSADVQSGKMPHDDQLFNLQTKFLATNIKGTDREMPLPVNFDVDQRPFIRPAGAPNTVLNHPNGVRMEGRSIPPLGTRKAKYKISGKLIKMSGKYKLSVRMRSRAEPIYFMKFIGATDEMISSMNHWMMDIHPYSAEFQIGSKGIASIKKTTTATAVTK